MEIEDLKVGQFIEVKFFDDDGNYHGPAEIIFIQSALINFPINLLIPTQPHFNSNFHIWTQEYGISQSKLLQFTFTRACLTEVVKILPEDQW